MSTLARIWARPPLGINYHPIKISLLDDAENIGMIEDARPCAQHQLLGHFFIDLGIVGDEIGLAVELRGVTPPRARMAWRNSSVKPKTVWRGRRLPACHCTEMYRRPCRNHRPLPRPQKTQPLHQKDGAPCRAAMEAAAMPAGPPPQTRTSTSSYSGSAQSVW